MATTKIFFLNEIEQDLIYESNKLGTTLETSVEGDYNAIDAIYSDHALNDDPYMEDPYELVYYNNLEAFETKRTNYDQIKLTIPESF